MYNKDCNLLIQGAKKLGINLNKTMLDQVNWLVQELMEKNLKHNLTGLRSEKDIIIKHFLDSWTLSEIIGQSGRLIDVGSGAGFPGLAIKVIRPDLEVVLLEAKEKKAAYIDRCIKDLNLKDVFVCTGRAEEMGRKKEWRESFDYATCRAVGHLVLVAEYCLPFLKIGGQLIAQKGKDIQKEIKESIDGIEKLGGIIEKVYSPHLKLLSERNVILVRKNILTPDNYPRRTGIPAKRPLITN